jgi:hypothetical protein
MGVLRDIGESIGRKIDKNTNGSRIVFKKEGKYYNEINGEEILGAEVGNRSVIAFKSK